MTFSDKQQQISCISWGKPIIPSLQAGKATNMALEQLATLLNRTDFTTPTTTIMDKKYNIIEPRVVKQQ